MYHASYPIPPCVCILAIYTMLMHIGSLEGVTLMEYELVEDEPMQEQEIQEPEEVPASELPECPEHLPTNFIKGKPRSIISLLFFYKIHLSSFMYVYALS